MEMEKQELNIADLIIIKYSLKTIIDIFGDEDESIVYDDLYQKVSLIIESKKTELQLSENTEMWKEIKPLLDKLENNCNSAYQNSKYIAHAKEDLIKIYTTSFKELVKNEKEF